MTNLQLDLSTAIPSILVLVGIFLDHSQFNCIETRLTKIAGDLRPFYRDLGRHYADIASLKDQRRA